MTAPLRGIKPAISYTIPEAAYAVGCGETKIRDAIKAREIPQRIIGNKPVILANDLLEWVEALPTERAS